MLDELSSESLRDRSLLLRTLPAFASLEDDTVSLLAEHVRLRRCRAGERLLTLGEPIHHVYNVLEGKVRWQRRDKPVAVASQQDVVGWLTLMAREPDGIDAVVEEDALVLETPAEVVEHVLEMDFTIIRSMVRMGANRLAERRGDLPVLPENAPKVEIGERRQRRTMVERLIDIRTVPIFQRGGIEALISLIRRQEDIELPAGHVLWERGAIATHWIMIEYGIVHCENAAGRSVDVGSGFVVGINDALGQRPRAFSARAETEVIGNRIDVSGFLAVLETHYALARDFTSFMARSVLDGD